VLTTASAVAATSLTSGAAPEACAMVRIVLW